MGVFETPEQLRRLENVTGASMDEISCWVNYRFNFCISSASCH